MNTQHFSQGYKIARLRWSKVKNDICPECDGSLDTGWECNQCNKDWIEIGQSEEPQPEDFTA